jgi:hypothetical protein
MGLSRRTYTKEFKLAAVQRIGQGLSRGEVARAPVVHPDYGGQNIASSAGTVHRTHP